MIRNGFVSPSFSGVVQRLPDPGFFPGSCFSKSFHTAHISRFIVCEPEWETFSEELMDWRNEQRYKLKLSFCSQRITKCNQL